MLIDRSARLWAMRGDDAFAGEVVAQREARGAFGAGEPLEGSDFARVVDGTAVIPVRGALLRSMSRFFFSYEEIARDLRLAQDDPGVTGIVLDIDSPGGMVAGVEDLANEIRGSSKPVAAFVGGTCASAAYFIAAAAGDITAGSGAIVGSVGTVIEYVDVEPVLERMGARIVRVVAAQSPNKRLDPDSAEGRAEMQALVDVSCAAFVSALARFRGVSAETVEGEFGAGLVFPAETALARGMIDARGTFKDVVSGLAARDPDETAATATAPKKEPDMDWDTLTTAAVREHRADIAAEIEAAAHAAGETAAQEQIAAAVAAERDRIMALDDVAIDGYDDLLAAAKADGKTTAADLALQIVKAEKASGGAHLAALREADVAVEPVEPTETVAAGDDPEAAAEAEWNKDAKLRAEFGSKDAFMAYRKASAAGNVRIYAAKSA